MTNGWAVKWRQTGANPNWEPHSHLITLPRWYPQYECYTLMFFPTRALARAWAKKHYGYIARRGDLRKYPHGWRSPVVVRATMEVKEITSDRKSASNHRRRKSRRCR